MMLFLCAAEAVLFGVVGRAAPECGEDALDLCGAFFFFGSHLGAASSCAKDRD